MKTLSFAQMFSRNKTVKMQALMKNGGITLDFQMMFF